MTGGAIAKTTAEKSARGTLQKCREEKRLARSVGSQFELTLEPPVGLTKDARTAWKLAIETAPPGSLLATDMSLLERWARNYAMYRRMAKIVEKEGPFVLDEDGQWCESPLMKTFLKVQQVLSVCEKELGFTPCSRARVNVRTKDEPEDDDFAGFA